MKTQLRILHLEDSPADCELIEQILAGEGLNCDIMRCDSREKFFKNLEEKTFDLIFADCTLPDFNGFHALEFAREKSPETPFIFISGSIGEDMAIESLHKGATDYVLKERLSRLVPAVRRAIAESEAKTKNEEMEASLRQAQRLEAVGTLAGGVAHDFNNILTIIKGHTSLLLLESDRADRVQAAAAIINHAAQRGTELVSQLLAFARKSDGAFSSTDINQRIQQITAMLREAFPRNIEFELELEDLPQIHADPGQLERVLINLATNARDAMPSGGKIIFSTSKVSGDKVPYRAAEASKQYLCLRVSDSGIGMDEATRQRIFEPFFTTKPRGKGTGLGMPVVYGLMQSHNGVIDVESSPGKGTSISLFFPMPTGPAPRLVETPAISLPTVEGTEQVLVVDDETDVSYFVEIILEAHGYRVLTARNAEAALEIIRTCPDEIHLLFSDIGLPKLDGFSLCQEVRKLKPNIKTVLTSGYAEGSVKTRIGELGIDGFISKPYDSATLLQTFRTALGKQ